MRFKELIKSEPLVSGGLQIEATRNTLHLGRVISIQTYSESLGVISNIFSFHTVQLYKHTRDFKEAWHSVDKNTINRHIDIPPVFLQLKNSSNLNNSHRRAPAVNNLATMTTTHPATTNQIPQSTKGTNQTLTTNTATERTARKLKFLVNI